MPAVEVETTGGRVASADPADHGGALAFLGIPYAESPLVDHLRLREPVPVASWDGVRRCDTYGASAPQPERGFTIIPEPVMPGDNCLNLNVFTPDVGAGAGGLPVFVWIHGGGFTSGCNASPWYHGRSFARDGVVTVAIGYRLGAEGFLEVPGAPTNRALRDWLLALQWVQDNIAAFGGDPGNVTIGGQSAGSVACGTLLAVPAARGMFGRAVLMSGGVSRIPSVDDAQRRAAAVAGALGVSATRDGLAAVAPADLVAAQESRTRSGRAGDPEPRAVRALRNLRKGMGYGPVVDGDVLPEAPLEAIRRGATNDIALLVGTTSEEADRAVPLGDVEEATAIAALEAAGASPDAARAYRAAYADETPAQVVGHAATDVMFRLGALDVLEARCAAGAAVHAYEFRWRSQVGLGAVHCLDLPFVWDVLDQEHVKVVGGDTPPQQLADDMHRRWVDFISSGAVAWPDYDLDTRRVIAFDDPISEVVDDPHRLARSTFER